MENKSMARKNMPPVIRVFISSTFSDMERERTYFNENLAPRLNRICAERGVSFFSVDLRWGITEEEQINGQVLPICLREIDKCRPFFIGILGSRYGSVMESVPAGIGETIPWLFGKEGKSITELEMLYAVLDKEKKDRAGNCAFYLRDDALSAELYGQASGDGKLSALKKTVLADETVPCITYGSLEQFGEAVMRDILRWLDLEFPAPEKVSEVRREWYDRELLRNYVPLPQLDRMLESYFQGSKRPLLLYGAGARGKTTFLTAWEPSDGRKVLVNCHSDDVFLYWPSIARDIIEQINRIQPDCGYPETELGASALFQMMQESRGEERPDRSQRLSTEFYLVTDQEREAFRTAFLRWLTSLELKEPVYLCINDLDLLEDESSRFLSWLPVSADSRIRLVCSTNDEDMVKNAETLGWNCREMPLFPETLAAEYIRGYLNIYGKNLSAHQLQRLSRSRAAACPGQLRFVADFLITYGRFQNLDQLIGDLSALDGLQGVYRYVYDRAASELTQSERALTGAVFGLLRCARMSLSEQECFLLAGRLTRASVLEWSNCRRVFEQFGLVRGDYWNMRDGEVREFAGSLLDAGEYVRVQELLADYMLEQLHREEGGWGSLRTIREKTAYAKALLAHCGQARNWERLASALADELVLHYLSKLDWQVVRVSWMKLYLYSDVDIPAALFRILARYRDGIGDARQITQMVAGLFADLSYRGYLEQAKQFIGAPHIAGSFALNEADFTGAFVELYNSLVDLKNSFQFRQLYDRLTQLFAGGQEYTPYQLCQLLFLKCDCERQLRLTEEYLKTCGDYYAHAIRAADAYEVQRSLAMRGDALYQLGRYGEVEAVQRRVLELALQSGAMRNYLAARNVLGMCQYRQNQFDESVRTFEELYACWKKLGDEPEAANVKMNKCNALYLSGDVRGALETARELYGTIPDGASVKLRSLKLAALSNIGYYQLRLKEYGAAEATLRKAVSACEEAGAEVTLRNSLAHLTELYIQTGRHMQAVDLYQRQMELCWRRKEYAALMRRLKQAARLLLSSHYFAAAEELQEKWRARFDRLPGGAEFFRREIHAAVVVDAQEAERLKEQLVLARSAADARQAAGLCSRLAGILGPDDWEQSAEYLLEAAELYRQAGDGAQAEDCLYRAAARLFEKGRVRSQTLLARLVDRVSDPTALRVIRLWERSGGGADGLREIVSCANACEGLVTCCLLDLTERIIEVCSAQQMIDMIGDLPEKAGQALRRQVGAAMLKNASEDTAFLVENYTGPAAEEKLAYYEKCMQVMEALKAEQFAGIAGNLATVYRRRNEEEKTFRCHTISLELYQKSGETRDYLIEMMNMATAYQHFHRPEQAIELLQRGIKEAGETGIRNIEASMAGNLASLLIQKRDPALFEEIMRCFEIEERYFRDAGEVRDLAISLLNQLVFYANSKRINGDPKKKLEEAGRLIRKNRFHEFERILLPLEQALAGGGPPQGVSIGPKEAERRLTRLLAAENAYRLDSLTVQEGQVYHAVCKPREPEAAGAELVHLFLPAAAPEELTAVFLYQPKLAHKDAAAAAGQFVDWWDRQGAPYQLQLHADDMVLQADHRMRAGDWDGVTQAFGRFLKFWTVDKLIINMICMGLADPEMYQEIKRKLLREDQ